MTLRSHDTQDLLLDDYVLPREVLRAVNGTLMGYTHNA